MQRAVDIFFQVSGEEIFSTQQRDISISSFLLTERLAHFDVPILWWLNIGVKYGSVPYQRELKNMPKTPTIWTGVAWIRHLSKNYPILSKALSVGGTSLTQKRNLAEENIENIVESKECSRIEESIERIIVFSKIWWNYFNEMIRKGRDVSCHWLIVCSLFTSVSFLSLVLCV